MAGRFCIQWLPTLLCGVEAAAYFVPVDYVPPGLQVVRTPVLILQVVGVLPHVYAEDGVVALHDGAILVGAADYGELLVGPNDQPGPAASESLCAGFVDLLLERVYPAE